MRKPIAQRIAELEEQKKSLVARLGQQQKARDTRRKILLGSCVLHHLTQPDDTEFVPQLTEWLRQNLPEFLTRDHDRDLFEDIFRPQTSATTSTPPMSPASSVPSMSPATPLPGGFDTGHRE